MTLTQLQAARNWWNHNGHFNIDLLIRVLEAKTNLKNQFKNGKHKI